MTIPPVYLDNLTLALIYSLLNITFLPVNFIQNRRNISRNLSSQWDKKMPYWEWFFIPYILGFIAIVVSPFVFAFLMEADVYKTFFITLSSTLLIDLLIWIVWPCKMIKTEKQGFLTNSFFVRSLLGYGKKFGDYNSFPSSHVTQVSVIMLWLCVLFPVFTILWVVLLILNALSILFTHQHYLADAISGGAIAAVFFLIITTIR